MKKKFFRKLSPGYCKKKFIYIIKNRHLSTLKITMNWKTTLILTFIGGLTGFTISHLIYKHAAKNFFKMCFVPSKDAEDSCYKFVTDGIESAEKSIHIDTSLFTYIDIAFALVNKKEKNTNIDIQVVVNKNSYDNLFGKSVLNYLAFNNITVSVQCSGSPHNKIMIVDGIYLFLGSLNLSFSGFFKNIENMIRIQNTYVLEKYEKRFKMAMLTSSPFTLHNFKCN